jgi:methylglyoxal synthase
MDNAMQEPVRIALVTRMTERPARGDLQIGARLATGELDVVIFLRDPMTPQPHEPASMRWCGPATCTRSRAQTRADEK